MLFVYIAMDTNLQIYLRKLHFFISNKQDNCRVIYVVLACQYFLLENTRNFAKGGDSTILRCCFFWLIVENLPTGKMYLLNTVAVRKKGRKVWNMYLMLTRQRQVKDWRWHYSIFGA